MAWSTTPYTDLATVKTILKTTVTTNDALITAFLPQVQQMIDTWVGHNFQFDGTLVAPSSRIYSGNDELVLLIRKCQAIVTITETAPTLALGFDGTIVAHPQTRDITQDVVLGPDNGDASGLFYLMKRKTGNPFFEGIQNYTVNGVWGYPSVPIDVKFAAAFATAHYVKTLDVLLSDQIIEGFQRIKYTKTLPDFVKEMLQRYRENAFLGDAV